MSRTKKHHFLSQYYLVKFTLPDKPTHVWQIEKPNGRNYQVSIRDAAECSDYHTMTDAAGNIDSTSVEQALSKVESTHKELLDRIITKACLWPGDRRLLAEFVALLDMRVPAFKKYIEDQYVAEFDAFGKVLLKDGRLDQSLKAHAGPKFTSYPPQIQKMFADRMRQMIAGGDLTITVPNVTLLQQMFDAAVDPRLLHVIERMGVTFFEAPDTAAFITGDTPVARFYPRQLTPGQYGVGLAHRDIQITVPLSAHFLARLDWSTAAMDYRMATDADVAEFNRRTIITAQKLIFARALPNDLLSLVHTNRTLSAGSEITLQHDNQKGTVLMQTSTKPVFPNECYGINSIP